MLVTMPEGSCKEPYTLLAGMRISAATLCLSVEGPQETKRALPYYPAIWYISEGI
jgi:hypothetical protein